MSKEEVINGKVFSYNEDTIFLVQVRKDKKTYETRSTFTGDFGKAWFYYETLHIGKASTKRIRIKGGMVIARVRREE